MNTVFVRYANLDNFDLNAIKASTIMSKQALSEAFSLSETRAKQFLTCRYLLAQILVQQLGQTQLPEIMIGDNQRPQFILPNQPDFNISHSGKYVAVGVATTGKIGVDIEQDRERKHYKNITEQFFSNAEHEWLNQQAKPLDAFWQLWTMRESALKLYAKGVWQMKQMAIDMDNHRITAEFANKFYSHYQKHPELHLSICCDTAIDTLTIYEMA